MRRRRWRALVVLALVAPLAAACGSSGPSSGGARTTSSSTYTIGILTDVTGLAAATYATSELGIKASFDAINKAGGINGHKLQYVVGDTDSTPAGALSAAQQLVQQDHAFAIIDLSSVFFGAAPWLLQQGVPVVGPGTDGPEWDEQSYTNLFNVAANKDMYAINSAWGHLVKANGGTVCGSVGASDVPSVTAAADVFVSSCKLAGLKGAPVNSTQPYGGTNMEPIALAFKNEGVNAIEMAASPNTSYALLGDLKQLGVDLKIALLDVGYGSDTLANKQTVAAAQGIGFVVAEVPIEVPGPATTKERQVLSAVGITVPTYAEAEAYISAAGLQAGLEKAGSGTVTRAKFMTAMRGITAFTANGLLPGVAAINFSQYDVRSTCVWAVKLIGDNFVPIPHIPYCSTAAADVPH